MSCLQRPKRVALPAAKEEMAPAFAHHEVGEFPLIMDDGKVVRVVIGSLYGERSPVPTVHETMFANIALRAGASLPLDADHEERQERPAERGDAGRRSRSGGARPDRLLLL